MDKAIKSILIAASAMVAVGLLMAGIGYAAGGNQPIQIDRNGIHVGSGGSVKGSAGAGFSGKTESFEEELGSFRSIKTDMNLYPVELIAGDKYAIEGVYDTGYGKPEYTIENDTLIVEERNDSFFNTGIDLGINFGGGDNKEGIRIYYPKGSELENVNIRAAAADLSFNGITADSAEFDISLGKLELSNITAKTIKATVGSGDCSLSSMRADSLNVANNLGKTTLKESNIETLEIKAQSGDVALSGVTAEQGRLELNLGKLSAENLNTRGLTVKNQSGDIELKGMLLGDTDITSNLGTVTVKPGASEDQFNYELKTDLGNVTAGGNESNGSLTAKNGAKNNLKISANLGDIKVEFNQ